MKDKFLIGELAKLFNISTDTLRHYDHIDLLKPEYEKNNAYRYYSVRSFFKLSRILFFKSLDISLEEIKKYMRNKNASNLLVLLKNKEDEIDNKINTLINLQRKIKTKRELLESINDELDQVKIKRIPVRRGVLLDMKNIGNDYEIKRAFIENEKYLKISSWLVEGQIYTSLSKESMENKAFGQFRYFIEIVSIESDQTDQLKIIPENDYACVAFVGPYKEMGKHYDMLIKWIDANGYKINGDSIEKNIVDYDFSNSENEYISEIQIPVNRGRFS